VRNEKIFMFRFMGRGRFVNPHAENLKRSVWDVILWKAGYYEDSHPNLSPPANFIYPASPKPHIRGKPTATWIGHSTYFLEVDGLHILTDPVWDLYCSPIPIKALRRQTLPPLLLTELPRIDLVLISHNHYDHLDAKTVATLHKLHPQIQWIVPSRLKNWFARRGIFNVIEIPWWESAPLKKAKVTAVPTQHFSGRTLWDQNKTHWNGYVLETENRRIYFTGDTGYNPKDFKAIGEKFPYMDLSLIPIGTYSPQKFMQPIHIGPQEAVQIHQEVKSRLSLGMHWKTFRLSDEPADRPPFDLYLSMKEKRLPFETFLPIDIGIQINF
jgi:N-acyl-phosphatidylethanolamine-hydrolysing phospholipase D